MSEDKVELTREQFDQLISLIKDLKSKVEKLEKERASLSTSRRRVTLHSLEAIQAEREEEFDAKLEKKLDEAVRAILHHCRVVPIKK